MERGYRVQGNRGTGYRGTREGSTAPCCCQTLDAPICLCAAPPPPPYLYPVLHPPPPPPAPRLALHACVLSWSRVPWPTLHPQPKLLYPCASMRRCQHGHIYLVGECGSAQEDARCPECGEWVGLLGSRIRADEFLNEFLNE